MKLGILITTCCIGTLAFADPSITNVTAKQRYPWNGKVDITYTASGIETAAKENAWTTSIKVTAKDNDTDTTYTATTLTGDTSFADGSHALVWDMAAQGLTFKSTNVVFDVVCETTPALYCIVDLSAGSTATSYPVSYLSEIPGGSWSDEYKTTKLVLRRIEPGTCVVTVDKPYYIGVFEVTGWQYWLIQPSQSTSICNKRPKVDVSYWDAEAIIGMLCERTGLRFDLPNEAQWEYACRAGATTTYSYGDIADGAYMWYAANYDYCKHDVGTRKANMWGLCDMHGSVYEWCIERITNEYGVVRGGCYGSSPEYCTSSWRWASYKLSIGYEDIGFRLIMNLSK